MAELPIFIYYCIIMNIEHTIILQGRSLSPTDIELIISLIKDNPSWHRTRLSRELCKLWSWYRPDGNLKDMACRTMLLKLERRGFLKLPAPVQSANNHLRGRQLPSILHCTVSIEGVLSEVYPLNIQEVRGNGYYEDLFNSLMYEYHYLSFKSTVGESMKYLVSDKDERPLGCLLFGSAAWKTVARDKHIGWTAQMREKNLNNLTNNTRFLILPWVKVPNLASFILGTVLRRLNKDWIKRYGHEISLVETFVEQNRFRGTCYRAANWQKIGETVGRSRQDRYSNMKVPIKDIYIYPLLKNYRELLCR